MARSDRRREPAFDDDRGDDLRAERRGARKNAHEGAEKPARARKNAQRRSGFLFGGLIYWTLVLGLWGAIGAGGIFVYYGSQLPPIDQLAIPKRPPNIAILAADGELLANRGDTGGAAVRLSELPPYLPKAFVAIEDRRFYSHFGIDPLGIVRALTRNVTGRGGVQGGSTLTQQLAKNLFLTQERTISRKIQEAILALWLEHKYSKDQILELYLNRVYFGSGAYGVEAAAERYYGHGAKAVTLAEAAVLAGLMKAPSKLAPDRNPEGASERAAQVITAMAQEGHITEAMAKVALANPARVHRDSGAGSINYAADYVMDVLADTVGAIDQDLVVTTTLDHNLQSAAEHALTDELAKKGSKFGVSQGAVVALDPNGAIRALVGGRDYGESQFNRAIAAKRQPGSSFKPFVYLTGLEHGLTPDTVREDGPINVKGWQPENYSREYFGPVTLTKALSLSLNTVAVRVGMEVGPKAVVRTAHRLGITSELQPNASLALGTSEVTPLGDGRGLCALRQWRHRRAAAYHNARPHGGRQAALRPQDGLQWPRHRAGICGDDEHDDGGDAAHRHRAQGGVAGLAGGRQDRHQPGLARRLVRRLHQPSRRRRLARQRRQFADAKGVRRQSAGRDLEPLHEDGASGRAGGGTAFGRLARRGAGAGAARRFRAEPVRRRPRRAAAARRTASRAAPPPRGLAGGRRRSKRRAARARAGGAAAARGYSDGRNEARGKKSAAEGRGKELF